MGLPAHTEAILAVVGAVSLVCCVVIAILVWLMSDSPEDH